MCLLLEYYWQVVIFIFVIQARTCTLKEIVEELEVDGGVSLTCSVLPTVRGFAGLLPSKLATWECQHFSLPLLNPPSSPMSFSHHS